MSHADAGTHLTRQANIRDCLIALRAASGSLTVSELSARTGLSRPTVDSVVQQLDGVGLITQTLPTAPPGPSQVRQPGRPARRITFDPSAVTVAGLDIGATSVRTVLTDAAGRVLARTTTAASGALDPATLARTLRTTGWEPDSVGLAIPGSLGTDGRVTHSLARPDLIGRDLATELADILERPVIAENDIKAAALAEHHLGASAENIVFVQIGHRISVALIVGGTILQGSHRLAGELGMQRGMRWTASSQRGRLAWSSGDEAQPVLDRAAAGDSAAQAEIAAFCEAIAPRLATVLLTIDPELVVIAGGLSRAGETFLGPLRNSLDRLLMSPQKPRIAPARLTTDGPLMGALGLAFDNGSRQMFGVPDLPPPWPQFTLSPSTPTHPTDQGTP